MLARLPEDPPLTLARLSRIIPYLVILAGCCVLYWLATRIDYTPRQGLIGPSFWPIAAIGLIAIAALAQIVALALSDGTGDVVQALGEDYEKEAAAEDPTSSQAQRSPLLLAGGMALILAYAVFMPVLGFILATYILLILFMYLGGMRKHTTVWGASTLGMLIIAVIFWKIAYISVPRGEPPFDQVTQFIMALLLVR
jgi:hypothetical protein